MKANMTPLSPKTKQALSALGVSLVGALLTWGNQYLHLLPGAWGVLGSLVLTGVAHFVPALGTEQATVEKIIEREAK